MAAKNPRWRLRKSVFFYFDPFLLRNGDYSNNRKTSSPLSEHFQKKRDQNRTIFEGVMALARRHVNGQKHVFCTKVHEILIFQYYPKNKYCADVVVTPAYQIS